MRRFLFERNPLSYVHVVSLLMGIVVATLIKDLQLSYLKKIPPDQAIAVLERYMAQSWAPWLPFAEVAVVVVLLWFMPTVETVNNDNDEYQELEVSWALDLDAEEQEQEEKEEEEDD